MRNQLSPSPNVNNSSVQAKKKSTAANTMQCVFNRLVPVVSVQQSLLKRIMLLTGHKTEQAFFKYIRIEKEENAKILAEHIFFK